MKLLMSTLVLFSTPARAGRFADWCERNIIAEDPYQYEGCSIQQLVTAWFNITHGGRMPGKALTNEIKKRLNDPKTTNEQCEILLKFTGVKK